jgi:hypothetical protein
VELAKSRYICLDSMLGGSAMYGDSTSLASAMLFCSGGEGRSSFDLHARMQLVGT